MTSPMRPVSVSAVWAFPRPPSAACFVAVDDHSRIAFTRTYRDERQASGVDFVREVTRCFAKLQVPVQRVLTDNGPAFHSARRAWA